MFKTGDLEESVGTRLPHGTGASIERVLGDKERASDFFRLAIEDLLQRREAELRERERQERLRDIAAWIA